MTRPALALLVVATTLLAGCSLVSPGPSSPAPVAPGVTERGLANASALAVANDASLREGFTLTHTYTDRIPEHDDYAITHRTTTRIGPMFERFHTITRTETRRNGSTNNDTTETWSNGSTVFTRLSNATGVRYERHDQARFSYGPSNLTHAGTIRDLTNGTVSRIDGSRNRLAWAVDRRGQRNRTGGGTATFDDRGRVFAVRSNTSLDTRVGRAHIAETVEWSDRGRTTVPRPAWLPAAVEATDG